MLVMKRYHGFRDVAGTMEPYKDNRGFTHAASPRFSDKTERIQSLLSIIFRNTTRTDIANH